MLEERRGGYQGVEMPVHALDTDHEIGERKVGEDLFEEFGDC